MHTIRPMLPWRPSTIEEVAAQLVRQLYGDAEAAFQSFLCCGSSKTVRSDSGKAAVKCPGLLVTRASRLSSSELQP